MKKILSKIATFGLLLTMMPTISVSAADNAVAFSDPNATSDNFYTIIMWDSPGGYQAASGTVITITASDSALITASSTSLGNGTVAAPVGSGTSQIQLTVATDISWPKVTYPIMISFPSQSPRNYSFTVSTNVPESLGAGFIYAFGGNEVNVTADVQATLSFDIKNDTDTGFTNSCALGTLNIGTEMTCAYRLKITTNAANGFQASISANHDLATGSATMTQVVDNAISVPGTEQYGIRVTGAMAGGMQSGAPTESVVEDAPANFTFNVDSSPVPTSTQNFIHYTAGGFDGVPSAASLTNTTLVEHFANIGIGTPAGNYSQVVTYTVTATF